MATLCLFRVVRGWEQLNWRCKDCRRSFDTYTSYYDHTHTWLCRLRRLWRWLKTPFIKEQKQQKSKSIESLAFPKEWQPDEKIVMTIRKTADYSPSKTFIQRIEAIKANRRRRTIFAHSKHFKRRQPTTARMLWKPDAKVEEDDA